MKRFITTAPRQEVDHNPRNPNEKLTAYEPIECEYLRYDKPGCFPVMNLMNAALEAGDEAELIIITAKDDSGADDKNGKPADYWCWYNYDLLSREASALAQERNAQLRIRCLEISFSETITAHLGNFQKIIRCFEEGDRIYADATYGSKPGMMALLIALNFGQRNLNLDVSVESVVYGLKIFGTDKREIYDLSRLFLMDQIVTELGEIRVEKPVEAIEKLLGLQTGGDDENT